jgi:2-methylaconitate cis-trans-isomerase PrpF
VRANYNPPSNFIRALPADTATRDALLLAVMGSPHEIQVDGIGGAHSVTSKAAMVSRSQRPGVDMDYLSAQVRINERGRGWALHFFSAPS